MAKKILISDPTLRDGNHAVRHQLSRDSFIAYCQAAEAAGVPIVEVGHGNGLGASSLLVGECSLSDEDILSTARQHLQRSLLGIHVIPGFCTIRKDLSRAVELGVDLFRIAAHCTEADITDRHIAYAREAGKQAWGVLMMSHMASPAVLLEEAKKMESYGAEAIVIMDSAGAYFPADVHERISTLVQGLNIPVGFHGHNNLGMAIINSVTAVEAGASIIDGTIRGFGAGAGNTQLEVLVAVFERLGFETGIDLYKILDAADVAEKTFNPVAPSISPLSIVSGLAGVFSGFAKPVARAAADYQVDARDIFFGLGKRNAVAGQESLIIEVARELAAAKG
ncbi:4-hydroxy-2-oxovalerate aldolase [Pseudoduganella danionis]|uniref:4-hydroxy-2-oxovalerate aldolase n=1 Tax=Pseudoduganella danionis TaxID=1890295 RepID=A0ABW9SSD2_9BURK|nr:4-hydroxy-2-oxovalerate aldolase [Pseudoduganella danionis]MTW35081.1 4-hydroxy-2-oxovalerate aldolase [Pseudoduganella danionis]